MNFDPDHAGVAAEGEHDPIAEVLVHGDEDPSFGHRTIQDFPVVSPILVDLLGSDHIMTLRPQAGRDFGLKHLIQIQAQALRRQPLFPRCVR